MTIIKQKCAIYTRKSTDKGLEQDFNTLDAQCEACLAYITSQKSEGWVPIKTLYDDGGFSGGTIERPALQQLIEDIKAKKINIVVVYKIDRLTRALTDFSKLVEVFDQYNVSFVSVTQSFNTTTSMGRLTLNVLLSFAQFEREVIGERIRDKIAASKKKGMWMGGCPPLGYDIKERHLIINKKEAKDIHYIFDRYLELGTILKLKEDLEKVDIKSKSWVSSTGREYKGKCYGYGALHNLLKNPVYAGYIKHKDELNEGLHEAIVPREKWQEVQDALISKASTVRGHKKARSKNILKGKLFDIEGARYTPSASNKKGKRYRYYVSQDCLQNRKGLKDVIARLPAHEIETLIVNSIVVELKNIEKLSGILELDIESNYKILEHISKHIESVPEIHKVIKRIIVDTDKLVIEVSIKELVNIINTSMGIVITANNEDDIHYLTVPYHTKCAHRGAVVIRSGDGKDLLDLPKNKLKTLVKGVIWRDAHFRGKSFVDIAKENSCSRSLVLQLVQRSLAFN